MMRKRVLNITLAAICVLLLNSCSMQHDVSESPSESTQQNGSVQSTEEPTEESGNKTDSDNDMAQNEYCFICLDESNDPVSGVKLQVCSDDRCTMLESDSNGVVTFDGVPEEYDIHVYSFPDDYELVTEKDFITGNEYEKYNIISKRLQYR